MTSQLPHGLEPGPGAPDPGRLSAGDAESMAADSTARKAPWSPRGIALIAFFFSILPGGILHALNFERLGLPELKKRHLIINTLSALVLILLAVATELHRLIFLVISLAYAVHFQVSQESFYQAFVRGGGKRASLWWPIVISFGVLLGVIGVVVAAIYLEEAGHDQRFAEAVELMESEQYDDAEAIFVDYQQTYPEDTNSHWNLAVIYSQTDRVEEAKQQLRQSLAIEGEAGDVKRFLRDLETNNGEFLELLSRANEYLNERQEVLRQDFKIGEHDRWNWDQETGELVFSNDSQPMVVAKIQLIGSISTVSNTWLWAWDNPTDLETMKRDSKEVQALGEEKQHWKLTTAKWDADESDGWEMTAIAAYVHQAKGAYRTPSDTGFTYMIINEIEWVK